MFRALLSLVRAVRQAWIVELVGAGLLVAGVYAAWGVPAALSATGVACLLKAYELDGDA